MDRYVGRKDVQISIGGLVWRLKVKCGCVILC